MVGCQQRNYLGLIKLLIPSEIIALQILMLGKVLAIVGFCLQTHAVHMNIERCMLLFIFFFTYGLEYLSGRNAQKHQIQAKKQLQS